MTEPGTSSSTSSVIREQQAWIRRRYPHLSPKYLFLGLRHQHQGQRPRTYQSYGVVLGKLDKIHGLTDAAGNPLRFSQTHRLRHTRATELLNDGCPSTSCSATSGMPPRK